MIGSLVSCQIQRRLLYDGDRWPRCILSGDGGDVQDPYDGGGVLCIEIQAYYGDGGVLKFLCTVV